MHVFCLHLIKQLAYTTLYACKMRTYTRTAWSSYNYILLILSNSYMRTAVIVFVWNMRPLKHYFSFVLEIKTLFTSSFLNLHCTSWVLQYRCRMHACKHDTTACGIQLCAFTLFFFMVHQNWRYHEVVPIYVYEKMIPQIPKVWYHEKICSFTYSIQRCQENSITNIQC